MAEWEAGDDDEDMEEAEGDGGAETGDAEAEDGPEDGGVEPTPKKVCARPAAAADPGAPAAGLLPGESYGCSKCRHVQIGCAWCPLLSRAGMKGYFMRGDGVIRRAA